MIFIRALRPLFYLGIILGNALFSFGYVSDRDWVLGAVFALSGAFFFAIFIVDIWRSRWALLLRQLKNGKLQLRSPLSFQSRSPHRSQRRLRWRSPFQRSLCRSGQPLIGFRAWGLIEGRRGEFRLMATASSTTWDSGAHAAQCLFEKHPAPQATCDCGFYAWSRPPRLHSVYVEGAVLCWGKVFIHAKEARYDAWGMGKRIGFRAEHVRILALLDRGLPRGVADRLSKHYQVPMFSSWKSLSLHAREYGVMVEEVQGAD